MSRLAILAAAILLLTLSACSPMPEFSASYDPASLRFSGERAFEIETGFVQRFPNRSSGQPNNKLAAEWLRAEFTRLGWECRLDEWEIVNYSRRIPVRNVVCQLPGESPREILVVAHHDQSPDTIQGADNDGSGIAILLHLAEIFANESKPKYTLTFASADAEEYGMLGTRRYIQTHPDTSQIVAGLSLDNLGKKWSNGMDMDPRGQFHGYGPLWLQRSAQEAARAAGDLWIPVIRSPVDQALEQAVPVSFMDEGPMVAAGVPALGFATRYAEGTSEQTWETYHTPGDTLETQSPDVLYQSGRIAEATIRQLLATDKFPQESGPYLYFEKSNLVLRGWPLWALFAGFVALFFGGSFLASGGKFSLNGLPHLLGLWLPLLASIVLLYVFVAVGLMDKYELYPATAKDEALFQPKWPAVILFVISLVVLLWLGRTLAGRFTDPAAMPTAAETKSLALLVVGLAGVYILLVNPFSLLFMVPLIAWFFIGGQSGAWRVLDIALFLLGGLVVYALFYFFGFVILRNNFAILWYLMMMFSIRMISFPAAVAITAIIGAGLSMIVSPRAP
jgi:hypothetical protein